MGKRAFLSVSDRTGIVELATGLQEMGYEIVANGATARTLRQIELQIEEVSPVPGLRGSLEPKLRLLQPGLFGALLADIGKSGETAAAGQLGQDPLDLVAVNLHPISDVLEDASLTQPEVLEYVDIGNAALLRAAARQFPRVIVLVDPADYPRVLDALREFGDISRDERQALAAKAFHYAAYYDSTIAQFLTERPEKLPDALVIGLKKSVELGYGENPHQKGAVYTVSGARPWGLAALKKLYGKDLSFNHFLDLETAWELAGEYAEPACAIVKHSQPCGAATADRLAEAFRLAFICDTQSAQHSVVAVNRPVDDETARALAEEFIECVLAPDFSQDAISILRHKKEIRLLTLPSNLLSAYEMQIHSISGGILVEDKDNVTFAADLKCPTKRLPSEAETQAARFAWKVAKHAKSTCFVLSKGTQTVGIGSGQPSRLDSLKIAINKSNERHPIFDPKKPLALATDGPLPIHCLHEAAKTGVSVVIQPGGSSEDRDTVRACDAHGITMLFTGLRHYKH